MQVQSNLGPPGISGSTAAAGSAVPEAAPPPPPPDETAPQQDAADAAAVAREQPPPPPSAEQKQVSPRARLNYDSEREEVYVEVLDRKTGEVLFTFPAKESESARLSGLGQGALVDQFA